MILVTGGAGFIGSNLHASLYAEQRDTVLCDRLGTQGKWRNLRHHPPLAMIAPEDLAGYLESHQVGTIVHLGAISETTATDGDMVWRQNVAFSQMLWRWCAAHDARFIYASSAATYGDGAAGFDDLGTTASLRGLKPLNLYGWSKHAFDLWVAHQVESGAPAPAAWAGVKFFNVYGPNEYHKSNMVSVVKVKHDEIAGGGRTVRLFRSYRDGIADGEQRRDFIWVGDAVAALQFMIDVPAIAGLFNLGTGTGRSYADVARAIGAANGKTVPIEYIDMPAELAGQYQYFTEAPMRRLREAGFLLPPTSLEDGIKTYVRDFLLRPDPYR